MVHHLLIPEPLRLQKFQQQLRGARVECPFRRVRQLWGKKKKKPCLVNATQNTVFILTTQIMALHSSFFLTLNWPLSGVQGRVLLILRWFMCRGPKDSNILRCYLITYPLLIHLLITNILPYYPSPSYPSTLLPYSTLLPIPCPRQFRKMIKYTR